MINTALTTECARAVGGIAQYHWDAGDSIRILWREVDAEQTWIVVVENAKWGDTIYVVNDETGEYAKLTAEQEARFEAGLSIYDPVTEDVT